MSRSPSGKALARRLLRQGRSFLLALGFLSRLAPALTADDETMRGSVIWYPAAGALLGLALVLPFALGLMAGHPFVQAWLYTLLSAWLTRALHLDGLADVLDALGSGKSGEAFFSILKDSRLGAFGAAGLALALAGQIILAAACFEAGRLAPLFLAPLLGRCMPALLAAVAPVNPKATLGLLLGAGKLGPALPAALLCALAFALPLLSGPGLLLCALLCAAVLLSLSRLARREGGFNGDFLGCAIIGGELAVLLAALV